MRTLIHACFERSRAVLLVLALVLIAGTIAYQGIPKEAEPDVQIPIVYVSLSHEGISPEDAERLLVRPMETALRTVEGIKELRSLASEGHASVTLEFEVGTDINRALTDVREEVDRAKADLPADTDEPVVEEVNLALFPVLVVTLSGELPERTLLRLARDLQDRIEGLPNVLEVDIAGDRDELLEIIIDPLRLESYGLQSEQLLTAIERNNRLVAAGSLDTGQGRFAVKVPGVFESAQDVLNLPLKAEGDRIVRLRDVGLVRRTFKDAEGFARVNGRPTLALEVKKRIGTNIIETIEQVRALVEREQAAWPRTIKVGFSQDKSDTIRMMLTDLENNVLSAIALVMIVVIGALGLRSGLLVGTAVPGSFLAGILVLATLGLTVNIVVLFALILATGMLVDGAIVTTELADRKMTEGLPRAEAYRLAATRMAWPITASTVTTLMAFLPLLFWPGIVGEFMRFLPITLIATLTASLAMALIFAPVLGMFVGRPGASDPKTMRALSAAEGGDLGSLRGITGLYVRTVGGALRHPGKVLAGAVVVAVGVFVAYGSFGRGVEFFPDVEPDVAQLHVHARGDLAAAERDRLVQEVEERILGLPGIETVYARSGVRFRGEGIDDDVIGIILMEFTDWQERAPASAILNEVRERTADVAGVWVEVRRQEAGPPVGKPVQLQIRSRLPERLPPVVEEVRGQVDRMTGLTDVSDSRPIPGIEWRFMVDREQAGRFGADITTVGTHVQLVTNGVRVGDYRPDDSDEEIDIRARYGLEDRNLEQFQRLRVNTEAGSVPVTNFVRIVPTPRVGDIHRVDGRRVYTVAADVAEGVLPDDKVRELRAWMAERRFDPEVELVFKGEDEEQQRSQAFLTQAFGAALFLIAIVLVLQFNSFYQALLILTAIVFSTVGVFLGHLIAQKPFGIVMSGIGVIALAGIVVNNNIVLIDTYNELKRRGLAPFEAILRTGAQRLRPVLLTTVTTILGLLPMVSRVNIDFVAREVTYGGPSTDWWQQLATAIAGGLAFSTLITLVLTPCLLMLGENVGAWRRRRAALRARRAAEARAPVRRHREPVPQPAE
ncbi:MAG TPA: efflux RND transporter permease subunit [Geminicoccaceae bacterium]|nr:efflux RND transporter permease subunit [Geminicoccaceae bacterium]